MMNDKNKPEDISDRVFRFVVNVLKITATLPKNQMNLVLTGQLIRCVTSIGANIEEARGAHTKTDSAYSMNIAKKESRETRYWLRLLLEMDPRFASAIKPLIQENEEIIKILTAIVKTAKPRRFND